MRVPEAFMGGMFALKRIFASKELVDVVTGFKILVWGGYVVGFWIGGSRVGRLGR